MLHPAVCLAAVRELQPAQGQVQEPAQELHPVQDHLLIQDREPQLPARLL